MQLCDAKKTVYNVQGHIKTHFTGENFEDFEVFRRVFLQ